MLATKGTKVATPAAPPAAAVATNKRRLLGLMLFSSLMTGFRIEGLWMQRSKIPELYRKRQPD
jgi:hypothetical protein